MKKPSKEVAEARAKGIEWERDLILKEISRRALQYLELTGESCGPLNQLLNAIRNGEHHNDHPEKKA